MSRASSRKKNEEIKTETKTTSKSKTKTGQVHGNRVEGAPLRLSRRSGGGGRDDSDASNESWSQLQANWSVDPTKQAVLSVDLLGTSPLAQATRRQKWGRDRGEHDTVERHHILDIWFTRTVSGTGRAKDAVWHLEWFFSRAVEDGKFRDAYRHFSSEEERKEFQQIGRRFLCFLLQKMALAAHLDQDDVISLHALPSEKNRLVQYYHGLGFRLMKRPHATDIPDKWTPMAATIATLLRHCKQ